MISPESKIRTLDSTASFAARSFTIFLPALFVAGLLAYKWEGSIKTIQKVWLSGLLSTRADVVALDKAIGFAAAGRTLNYFAVIWPALAFGILIGAAVRAFVPPEWLARAFSGRRLRGQLTAGAAGAPLMLCSCCVAPVFGAVYERSSRLGPSLALMLASPSLNPAALVLTFMLFSPNIAVARMLMAGSAVLFGGVLIERLFRNAAPIPIHRDQTAAYKTPKGFHEIASAFLRSLSYMVVRTIPALILGVICSMLLVQYVPKEFLSSSGFRYLAVVATASIAVPLALPTFFEIPLALGLLTAGAPIGVAAALLFAGPAVNLPSLLTLAKSTNWKIAMALAVFIWAIAVAGGLLLT